MRPQLHTYDIAKGVFAFSSLRKGGASKGTFCAFNINEYCGDSSEHVTRNKQLLADILGIPSQNILVPHQVHGTKVACVDQEMLNQPAEKRQEYLDDVDAIITQERGLCIGVSTADCIPILLYDAQQQAIAAVHAGWRGTVARIVEKTIHTMTQAFDTQPQHLYGAIGPGISLEAFEVGDEVYEAFQQAAFDMPAIACQKAKWHIDLPRCNQLQLIEKGVPSQHIIMSHICTYQQSEDYFSARKLGIHSGRIYSGIMLQPLHC